MLQSRRTNIPESGSVAPTEQGPDYSRYPASTVQSQQGESNFSDGSEPLFSMYLEFSEEEDRKMTESWKGDADGILVFTGLFSAAVAALLAITIQDIRPSSQDTSAYYLATISQQVAQLTGTQISIPSTLSNPAVSFTAPTWAVWVNGLWSSSLIISITCAVLATLLQQWARRYLKVAYPRYSPHKRARLRAFYAKGVDRFHLPWMVEVLPALLHISLFLFFSGLAVLMFGVNPSIFKVVIVLVGLCTVVYAYLTILPVLHMNSPYSTPLTALISFCLTGMRSALYQLVQTLSGLGSTITMRLCNRVSTTAHVDEFSHNICKASELLALQLGPEIDYESILWTFESLDEDKELEQFFEGVPGLCGSRAVPNAQGGVIKRHEKKFSSALIEFMNRTLSSSLVSESVKRRRIKICTKVIDTTSLLGPWWILRRVLLGDWQKFLGCIEFALFVKNWKSITHSVTFFYAECVAAIAISSVKVRDRRWFELASGPLGASKNLLLNYFTHCDNIFLVNVISIVRRTIQTYSGSPDRHRGDILGASTKVLESLCKFDIKRTLPELQHEFCIVWNQLVGLAQNDERPHIVCVSQMTLKNIRKMYIVLHKGTSASPTVFSSSTDDGDPVLYDPMSYYMCALAEHRSDKVVPELKIEEPAQEPAQDFTHSPYSQW